MFFCSSHQLKFYVPVFQGRQIVRFSPPIKRYIQKMTLKQLRWESLCKVLSLLDIVLFCKNIFFQEVFCRPFIPSLYGAGKDGWSLIAAMLRYVLSINECEKPYQGIINKCFVKSKTNFVFLATAGLLPEPMST